MSSVLATALAVGLLGGAATWLFLSVGTLLIWAAFVAWASYFAVGGDNRAIPLNITSNAFGAVMAWLVAVLGLANPLAAMPLPVWLGLLVFASVVIYILASRFAPFSSVPAVTFGYATTFAYLSQTPGAFTHAALFSLTLANALPIVVISMTIGTLFAAASAKLAAGLTSVPATT
ncbi:hypothetical protein GCM10007301_29780 [Azorhizobium oxalatiphilum]|uniref:DUF1097 domain-containing protein n=1 Tax=Azorhizobium oxalatiphilum TaxID=980631 RepID=A0A917FCJ5_9HYPH|nr:DUF1097 domain-containing protein [Azorhizobium oxalatiphilum]GGF68143.1 hypothetical protein GCM10007301_29780 [Azorhizobium oxalatiphilum]